MSGARAEAIAEALIEASGNDAGPVIREATGFRWMYFLLASGAADGHRWPPGVQRFCGTRPSGACYVGVPALVGRTWPLIWQSKPTTDASFVDAELLHRVVTAGAK